MAPSRGSGRPRWASGPGSSSPARRRRSAWAGKRSGSANGCAARFADIPAMESVSMIGGRSQLVDVVAEGGLSTVWQGVARSSEVLARPVAIKVMKRAFSAVGGPYLSMFLEEARIGARLQHANVIQVLD